jgi:hypothetical protein
MKRLLAASLIIATVLLSGCGETHDITHLKYIQSVEKKGDNGAKYYDLIFQDTSGEMHTYKLFDLSITVLEKGRIYDVTVTNGDKWTTADLVQKISLSNN